MESVMAFGAEQDDVGIISLSPQSLVQAMTSGVLAGSGGAFEATAAVEVVELKPRLGIGSAIVTRTAVQLQRVMAQHAAMQAAVLFPIVVVCSCFFQVLFAEMLSVNRRLVAITTNTDTSLFVVRGEGLS
jgi:hypothetical protein